ncbi:MAG: FapA family protein [Bacillota bacterium]
MGERIEIEAKNKEQALKEAAEHFGEDYDPDRISVEVLEEKSSFLGFNKRKKYAIELKEEPLDQDEERILESAEDIGLDGEFSIKFTEEGVFIRITAPEGGGERVDLETAHAELKKRKIEEVDDHTVREAVREADGEWYKIAPRKPELDKDAEIQVEISEDKLKAFVSYYPPLGGVNVTLLDARQRLKEENVIYGIKEDKLEEILSSSDSQKHVLIAEGDEPEPGKDAEIKYHFEEKEESIGTEREDGSIDFYNLGLINNVEAGDVLATLKEAEPGNPGMAVTGEEVPPPEPRQKSLKPGKNVKKQDEKTLIADVAGQVVKKNDKVEVLPVHEVNGDVDLNTGNIDFVGNVHVRGSVHEGFEVKARGNVEIRGNVSGAKITSGGEVVVHKGFIGKNKGLIEADGDVKAKFVENGEIKAGNNIEVTDAVMHSRLSAGNNIKITQKKGLLVGGSSRATSEIEVNIVGSALATDTKIAAGIDPELKNRLAELDEEIEEDNHNLLKAKKALELLENMKQKSQLPPNKEKTYYKLVNTQERLEDALEDKKAERERISEQMRNSTQGRIKVYQKIFPGVQIYVGNAQKHIKNETSRTMFVENEGEVTMVNL